MTTDTSLPVSSQSGSRPAHGAPSISGSRGRRAQRHPLLGAFPLAVMTLATFLVVFALLMARLERGADPALSARNASVSRHASQVLVRRIYERVVVVHLPATARQPSSGSSQQISSEGAAAPAAAVTRTS